jgi:DNA-binding transcriptional LysR family regulator
MDLWHLNIFYKVIELKSFSKTGKRIHLSQPTISSHIKSLEDHFGCRLIDRLSKEAVPTKAGKLLYNFARRLLLNIAGKNNGSITFKKFKGYSGKTVP